jgi:hypothetical protein
VREWPFFRPFDDLIAFFFSINNLTLRGVFGSLIFHVNRREIGPELNFFARFARHWRLKTANTGRPMLRKNTPTTVERKSPAGTLFAVYSQPCASPRVPPGNLASDDSTTAPIGLQAGNSIFRSDRVPSLLSHAGIESDIAKNLYPSLVC